MLQVYADHLESIGEPRGELISIDLRIDESGPTPELRAYSKELIDRWFGFQPAGVRHGFVDIDATSAHPVEQLELLDGPAAPFVKSINIVGAPSTINDGLAKLAETPRPWLVRLVVRQWSEGKTPTIGTAGAEALAACAPHLAHLEVDGRRVFRDFTHPRLGSARLSGIDAIGALDAPALHTLDFALHAHLASTHEPKLLVRQLRTLVPAALTPKLATLDLSRNLPGYLDPDTLGGGEDIFAVLDDYLAVRAQLEVLRMPKATPAQLATLQAARRNMPKLRECVVAGQLVE